MSVSALRAATLLCAAISLLFLGWSYLAWSSPPIDLMARPLLPWSPSDIQTLALDRQDSAVLVLDAALAKPLFLKTRRPFEPPVHQAVPEPTDDNLDSPPPPTPSPGAPDLVLKGIVIASDRRFALIASAQVPEGFWLTTGGEIDGWTLIALDAETATFQFGSQFTKLKLYVDNPQMPVGSGSSGP